MEEVIARLRQMLAARNLRIFADLDFSADAAADGLSLRRTRMLIAGNPKAGTPLIEAVPAVAIDLPLKVLVWSVDGRHESRLQRSPVHWSPTWAAGGPGPGNIAGFGALVEKAAGG